MEQEQVDLFFGSLLHDIGKVVQRSTKQKVKHSQLGKDFLKEYNFNNNVLDQVSYHHSYELLNSKLNNNNLAYITYIADNIASGIDRRDDKENKIEDGTQVFNSTMPLESIFNKFGEQDGNRYYSPQLLDVSKAPNYPSKTRKDFTSGTYSEIVEKIRTNLQVIEHTPDYMDSLLNVLEATLSYVPSSTNQKEVSDISLYDHVKVTAGVAAAIYQYIETDNRTDYKSELYTNSIDFYNEKAFILASFDLSGVQDFIYTIATKGAHKQLRSRSFYLDMISEWLADTILTKLDLSRANLLYTGGGHAYVILPNTKRAVEILDNVEQSFNKFFIDNYGTRLYVAFGHATFSGSEVMKGNEPEEYREIFSSVNEIISEKKISRYSVETILELNKKGKKTGRECSVCHTTFNLLDSENKCSVCSGLENFSKNIQNEDYFVVNSVPSNLPIGPNAYLSNVNEKDIMNKSVTGQIYSKNNQNTGLNQATHIWVADANAAPRNEYSHFTDRKWSRDKHNEITGIKRMGVLRADVDDLGFGFMAGYSYQGQGTYNTLSRTASFSRNMSLFFKLYINQIAEKYEVTIIYSGGDDVFAIGAWDEIIEFTVDLRENFLFWTNDKLTLSAGIGMFPEKTPINILSRKTGELEQAAKDSGKNAICLFDTENTFNFDEFIDDIRDNYLHTISEYFDQQDSKGKSFMYKILYLIEERKSGEKISFAHLAYTIARLEDANDSSRDNFNSFKDSLEYAFDDDNEMRKFEMALRLYIYQTRKDG